MTNMLDALRRVQTVMNPVRARAKVLARADREMRADLVRIRRESGLTQQDVADRMGVSQQAVYKLERYDADPRQSTVQRYANAVGALVEHRVYVDRGQSVHLANDAGWESVQTARRHSVTRAARPRFTVVEGWSAAARIEVRA